MGPGTVLEGRYELLEALGETGPLQAWKARHVERRTLHVVRALDAAHAERPALRARLLADGHLLTRLRHPHVQQVTDVLTRPVPALVVEHVAGPTLADWLHGLGRRPTLPEVRDLFLPLLGAVGAAHDLGLVHRDLRPVHVVLAREPGGDVCPKLGGFAVSDPEEPLPVTPFTCPELLRGEPADVRSDVFSLGCVLYAMLAGHSPFDADHEHVVRTAIAEGLYPDLATIAPGLPPSLYAAVRRALAKDPAARFPDCGALALALTGLGEATSTVPARPPAPPPLPPAAAPPPAASATRPPPPPPDEDDDDAPTAPPTTRYPPPPVEPSPPPPPARRGGGLLVAVAVLGLLGLGGAGAVGFALIAREPSGSPTFLADQGYRLVEVPAGSFTMGSPVDAPDRWKDEVEHPVTISGPFHLGATEVTRGLWATVRGEPAGADAALPVAGVSWRDAVDFCNRVSILEGRAPAYVIEGPTVRWDRGTDGYRLPTEAEWEFAARAGATSAFAGADTATTVAWIDRNAEGAPRSPAALAPNALGLFDMSGNVAEWAWDWYGPYPAGPTTDPVGPETGESRVHRGGSWLDAERYARVAYRRSELPDVHAPAVGLRLAR